MPMNREATHRAFKEHRAIREEIGAAPVSFRSIRRPDDIEKPYRAALRQIAERGLDPDQVINLGASAYVGSVAPTVQDIASQQAEAQQTEAQSQTTEAAAAPVNPAPQGETAIK